MQAIEKISQMTGTPVSLGEIKKWNKGKEYPVQIIKITISGDGVTDNSEELSGVIDVLEDGVDKTISSLPIDDLKNLADSTRQIYQWINVTRIAQTKPLGAVVTKFTTQEKRLVGIGEKLKSQIEKLQEEDFLKAEKAIKTEINIQLEATGFEPSLASFDGFITKKRKTQIFTTKGALTAGIKKAIGEIVEEIVSPLREAKALQDKKDHQHNTLSTMIDGRDLDQLHELKMQVSILFPDIQVFANRQIVLEVEKINRAAKIQKEKDDAAKERAKELESKQAISESIQTAPSDKVEKTNDSPFQHVASVMSDVMDAIEGNESKGKAFSISIEDLMPLTHREFEGTQDEAKAAMVKAFEFHLSMIDLEQK